MYLQALRSWLAVQFVECINISNQSLASTALGQKDTPYAFEVVKRHLVYATVLIAIMGGLLLTFHQQILGLFTPDSTVVATAWTVLPLVAVALPLDAISTIADGTLTAAGCVVPLCLSSVGGSSVGGYVTFLPCVMLPNR